MAKYISFSTATEVVGKENMDVLVARGICKRGNGKVLALSKDGEWVSAPLANAEKIYSYLTKRLPKKEVEVVKAPVLDLVSPRSIKEILVKGCGKDTPITELGGGNLFSTWLYVANDTKEGHKKFTIWGFADMTTKYYETSLGSALVMTYFLRELILEGATSESPRGKAFLAKVKNETLKGRLELTLDMHLPKKTKK